MKSVALLVALAIVTPGCPLGPAPPPPPPPDPTPYPDASCASWCTHAAALHCDAAKTTPHGATCEDVCSNVQKSGVVAWDLKCRTSAKTCESADLCER